MDGTILSIMAPGQEPKFILTVNNNTKVRSCSVTLDWPAIFTKKKSTVWAWQEATLTFGENKISIKDPLRKMEINFQPDFIRLLKDKSEINHSMIEVSHAGYLEKWRNGQLGLGGLLGEIKLVCTISIAKAKVLIWCGYQRKVCVITRFMFFNFQVRVRMKWVHSSWQAV